MGLTTYQSKRNFRSTNEPRGTKNKSSGKLQFVIQKHNASRLHYDLRLELDGVLLSWAVPKGPSLNPAEKHLAVQVEDHPYDYKNFEGVIAAGNYGAGEVIVWDNGNYTCPGAASLKAVESAMRKGLAKGHIEVVLEGKKLQGLFQLVRMKEKEWLLIKSKDKFAAKRDVLKEDRSVISGKKVEELNGPRNKSISSKKKSAGSKKSTSKKTKSSPRKLNHIPPMLAQLADTIPSDKNLLIELKYDGYRALAHTDGNGEQVELFSRNGKSLLDKFPSLRDEISGIHHAVVLDGEVVVEDESGRSKFQLLQQHAKSKTGEVKYYVFDLLFLNGEDIQHLPLSDRKKLLTELFRSIDSDKIILVKSKKSFTPAMLKELKENGYEGVIAKSSDAPYMSGLRTSAWLKIKNVAMQEAVIIGYTSPGGTRTHFGALLLAAMVNGKLKYIGKCGTGFSSATLKDLWQRMQRLKVSKPAVSIPASEKSVATFLKPKLICEVKFTEFTSDGILRHPAFRGLREDKSLKSLNNDIPIPDKTEKKKKVASRKTKNKTVDTLDDDSVSITNPDKLYWPSLKITKGMLIEYYRKAAPYILPFIKDRLHSLHRHPNGIKGESFYQKNVNVSSLPEGLETKAIRSESKGSIVNYFLCNGLPSLLYMANLGCIEINPWNNSADNYDHPDWMVIDLDPEDIGFDAVVKTALQVKKLLDEVKVPSYIKTSGSTGLHIYVPMGKKYTYDEVRLFAELVARTVHNRIPEITSIVRAPAKRKKKVYLDYLQNRHGQTLAAPFSVRPKPNATVSMPLEWKEVNSRLDIEKFTMKNMQKRAKKAFEIWKPVLGKGVDLKKAVKAIMKLKE